MKHKIFCRRSLFPSWSGQGLISTPIFSFINSSKRQNYYDLTQVDPFLLSSNRHMFILKHVNLLHTCIVVSVMLTGADLMSNVGILFRISPAI